VPFKVVKGTDDHSKWARILAYAGGGAAAFVVALAVVSRVGCVNVVTPAGHEGYIKSNPIFGEAEFVGIQEGPTSTGWVWRQQVVNIDVRPRTFSEEMRILTAERLELRFRVHARIRLREGEVKRLVEEFGGKNWYRANVQQQLRSVVRAKVQELKAFQVKNRMAEIAEWVLERLRKRYGETPIQFMSVDIGDIQYPEVVVRSVVRKFVTNEDNERKDIELKIAKRKIEIGIAEAEGISDAQLIIRTTLDPMFVQYEALKAIEKLAGSKNTTFVITPFGETGRSPLIMSMEK
jgi:hypothetical protein